MSSQSCFTCGRPGHFAKVCRLNQLEQGTSVYVGNLSWDVSWQDLKDHMKAAGNVEHSDVMRSGGRSRGFGVVRFTDSASAERAISELDGTELQGRNIVVRPDKHESSFTDGAVKTCHQCGQEGHIKARCPELSEERPPKTCHQCGEEGHIKARCPELTVEKPKSVERPPKTCHQCGQEGHIKANCSAPAGSEKHYDGGFRGLCSNCKEFGHKASQCNASTVCHNCFEPGHKMFECENEGRCKRCKQTGHKVAECEADPLCHKCQKPGHLAVNCAA